MLQIARRRLGSQNVEIHPQDLRERLPAGPFHAILSALAIHHLENEDKRDLLARIYSRLGPGGVFVNAEQLASGAPWLDRVVHANWRAECLENGASMQELAAAEERMRCDRCVDAQTQIAWMRQIGFLHSDCFFRSWRFGVIAGWRRR